MSRVILNDHPWDESEVQYMLDRNRREEVEQNRIQFPPGTSEDVGPESEPKPPKLDPDIYQRVKALDADGVRKELKAADLQTDGSESELKVRLAQHLQGQRNAGSNP